MCGFLGCNFSTPNFSKALSLLKDRGPDNISIFTHKNTVLGHTRLSIINLSSYANQPMSLGDLTIVFNGEIYNYKELADELDISISSDTEILLYLYKKYGVHFLHKLNGMFSFVIYDSSKDIYFGARDAFGKKPFYYYKKNKQFIFSSRINAILKLLDHIPDINLKALDGYLSFMAPIGQDTFYNDIFKLEAGTFFTLKGDDFKISNFETLNNIPLNNIDFKEAKAKSLNLLRNSLRLRLNSDVGLSFLLSGGLDSSMICALYAKEFGNTLDTFSLGFSEHRHYDETKEALDVAKFIGSNHHEIILNKNIFFEILDKFYDFVDEPLADSATIPTYFLSKNIHENGFKVALSGEGSDECFLGYNLYFRVLEFYKENYKKEDYPSISKDFEYLRRKELKLPIYGSAGEVFTRWQKEKLLLSLKPCEILKRYKNNYRNLRQMSYIDFKIWISEVLTTKIDRASMANSLEIRSPFLDINLVKFTLGLSDETKYQDKTKQILKSIAKDYLPEETINRKKKGFSSPFIEWLLEEFKDDIINEILSVNKFIPLFNDEFVKMLFLKASNGNFKQHLWTLFMFVKWFKKRYI